MKIIAGLYKNPWHEYYLLPTIRIREDELLLRKSDIEITFMFLCFEAWIYLKRRPAHED